MASLFEKIQTLINANLHGMVDRALEANSLKVMDEYIRQVQQNLEALEDSAATVGGTVRTLKRKYEEFAAAAEKLDRDIDTLIIKGKNDLAAAAQAELNTKQELAQEYYQQWQMQEKQYKQMLDMRLKLETRLTTIKQERERLRALMELAETKKIMTKTVKSLEGLANTGDKEIDSLSQQIRARLDREDARLELASRRIGEEISEAVGSSQIDMQLEERRARLLGKSGGES
ncbi:MAG: PspA/IM30 family protein [Anaerolineae bacterium]|nr:PspA/IM30 family protein [Anaerolineae bacterium]MDW8171303.1 PspA/IM30 family protein [Anaerolineae bacterium]